jgi:hypothetical protein
MKQTFKNKQTDKTHTHPQKQRNKQTKKQNKTNKKP